MKQTALTTGEPIPSSEGDAKARERLDTMTTVGIVEDNVVIRESLKVFINETPGCRVSVACATAEEALYLIPRQPPDVVLMDIHLPNLSGIECTARLKQLLPGLQVIMHTVYEDADKIFKALKSGACGYLLKRATPEQIMAAIHEVRSGGAPMSSEIARKVVAAFQEPGPTAGPSENLSRREREVLELLARGFSNKEIADQLHLSVETVRGHLKQIYDKLHVHSRTEAVLKFIAPGPLPA